MDIPPTAMLLAEIKQFLRDTGMAPTTFGIEAVSDPNLVYQLNKGRELRHQTIVRVRAYMKAKRD